MYSLSNSSLDLVKVMPMTTYWYMSTERRLLAKSLAIYCAIKDKECLSFTKITLSLQNEPVGLIIWGFGDD